MKLISTKATSNTTFFDLPAELRNVIYNYALLQDTPVGLPYAYVNRPFAEPALLSAHRRIRAEALAIFYSSNAFEASSPSSAHYFLSQLRPECISQIRSFRPTNLVVPLSAPDRWIDAFKATVNRLVAVDGQGALHPDAIQVHVRDDSGKAYWVRLRDIKNLRVIPGNEGSWIITRRDRYGQGSNWKRVDGDE